MAIFPPELQANCAVCRADDSGATALSYSASSKNLYGTQCIGLFGKIRSWKSVSWYLLVDCSYLLIASLLTFWCIIGGSPSNAGKADGTRVLPQSKSPMCCILFADFLALRICLLVISCCFHCFFHTLSYNFQTFFFGHSWNNFFNSLFLHHIVCFHRLCMVLVVLVGGIVCRLVLDFHFAMSMRGYRALKVYLGARCIERHTKHIMFFGGPVWIPRGLVVRSNTMWWTTCFS